MATATISHIEEQLKQQQWTSTTVDKINTSDLKQIDTALAEIDAENDAQDTLLNIFEEQLKQNPKNIIALFGTAIIYLQNKSIDDTYIVELIDIFKRSKRWGMLEILCQRFLSFGENRMLLRELSHSYEMLGDIDKTLNTWERLVRVDFKETEIVEKLADTYQKQGNTNKAMSYYKKLLFRSINARDFENVQNALNQLIETSADSIDFFIHVASKVSKNIGSEQSVLILESLYPTYKKRKEWSNAITVLKQIFEQQSNNVWARKELVHCYRHQYANHSNLDNFIQASNISQNWRNIHEAIADFEKHISFDTKNFVFHRSWGVGVIRSIERDKIIVDFPKHRGHEMSFKMALTALEVLQKNHIWVLRSVLDPRKLNKMVKENVAEILKIIINSFGNSVTLKRIRSELVPYVLSETEWTNWSTKARKVLKTDGIFGTVADMPDHYEVRKNRSSNIEKIYNSFMAEKKFNNRVKVVFELMKLGEYNAQESDAELLREIWEYFNGFVHARDQDIILRVSSLLAARWIVDRYSVLKVDTDKNAHTLHSIIRNSKKALALYQQMDNRNLEILFLHAIADELDSGIWVDTYLEILHTAPARIVLEKLHSAGFVDKAVDVIKNICINYRTYRESFVWLLLHQNQYTWMRDGLPDPIHATVAMAHLFDINAVDIANKRNLVETRKLHRQIYRYLYTDRNLDMLVDAADANIISQIVPILNEIQKMAPAQTIAQKQKIGERFPDLLITELEMRPPAKTVDESDRFLTLNDSLHRQQERLRHLHEVEVPKNSKEIQKALEKGDLRENAEYKSAKEHQEILNATAMRLEQEIARAIAYKPNKIDKDTIGFGCTAHLKDVVRDITVSYIILGPWESDPDNNIISYLSPLGNNLYNHKKGETLTFTINNIEHKYIIENIEYPNATAS